MPVIKETFTTFPVIVTDAPTPRGALDRSWIPVVVFTTVGVLAIVAYVLWDDIVARAVMYDATGIGSIGAALLGMAIHRPANRRAWLVIALALGCWVAGDLVWDYLDLVVGASPTPSWADCLYLAGYPVFIVGVLGLVRPTGRRVDVPGILDAAVVAIGFGLAFWVFVIVPTLTDPGANDLERAVSTLYPVGDILVLAIIVRFVLGLQRVTISASLLAFGLVLQVVADSLFAQRLVDVSDATGLQVIWIAGYVAFGAAALHPAVAEPLRPRPPGPSVSGRRLLVLMTASLLAPAVLYVQWLVGMVIEAPAIALASATLFSLVVARIAGLVRALQATIADREVLAIELRRLALHDSLTGLANRALFADRLDQALARRDPEPAVGLIYLDLDEFKIVNDELGHAAGDALLQAVARRICATIRPEDTVARLGGDEFGLIIDRVESAEVVRRIGARVREAIEQPVEVGKRTVAPRASIGTAIGVPGRADPDELLRQADFSMYVEKRDRLQAAAFALQS